MIRMLTRRNFMLATAGGLFTAPSPGAQQRPASAGARMLQMNAFPTNAETPLDLLTAYIRADICTTDGMP